MTPKSYKVSSRCCIDCDFCFIQIEYDDSSQHYCTFGDKKPRPKCGSVLMQECFGNDEKDWQINYRLWYKWSRKREVLAHGTCDKFCEREETKNEN